MALVLWVVFAPVAIGLVEWAAICAVGARQVAITRQQIMRRIRWCYGVLFLAFLLAGVLAETTAAVARKLENPASQVPNDLFFWSQPARDAVVDGLFIALDAAGLALCAGGFGLTLLAVLYLRERYPLGYRDPTRFQRDQDGRLPPLARQLWMGWLILPFPVGVGLHVLATPDGILLSAAVAALSAVAFGLVAWVEWRVWRENRKRWAKSAAPQVRTLTGRRRTVVAISAGFLGGSAASWAVLALLYEGHLATSSSTASKVGMLVVAALLGVVRAFADLTRDRAETALG
ncbi:hypothetical protein ACFCV3_13515 [Kribbella sp. NPDC056345]|uniref:hypothetical protein n=1 Tax=Kribbella sp. NPDC056345 TaxID=3345789 RepID=UPI0035E01DC1